MIENKYTKEDYKRLYLGESKKPDILSMQFGRLPPQAVDVECAVLGALILSSQKRDEVIPILKPEIFYKDAHSLIFSAIQALYNSGSAIDLLTITQELIRNGDLELIGGAYYLTELTRPVASSQNLESHARIITQKFIQREIIRKTGEIYNDGYSDSCDIFDLVANLENFVTDLNKYIVGKDYESDYAELVEKTYQEILTKKELKFTGIDTGSEKLNQITGGWQKTDLIIEAARPGIGKTTRMVSFAKAAALSGKRVAIFTLEMSSGQIVKKQLSEQSGVYGDKILNSNLNEFDLPKLFMAKDKLKQLPIYINDKPSVSPNYIRAVCKERKKKYGLDMIFIDYIQLLKPNTQVKGRNREQDISEISSSLKSMAKEFEVPVMALSQLNREMEKRGDKRPILSDLRESGSLEQDADIVLGLYRPSKYHKFENDGDYKDRPELTDESYKRISETHVLKHRNGKADIYFEECFYGELSRYEANGQTVELEPKKESNDIAF